MSLKVDNADFHQYTVQAQRRIYARWAPIYDNLYSHLLADAHRGAADRACACGPDILEVGVGTGLSLSHYSARSRVIGVDISEHMLRKSMKKVRGGSLRQVRLLAAMDACQLGFPADNFDAVTVPFVITLVPNPEAALDEFARVLKIGGEVILVNKIGADHGLQALVERWADPVVRKIGWSCAFKLSRIAEWADSHGGMELIETTSLAPAGFFTLIRLRKSR